MDEEEIGKAFHKWDSSLPDRRYSTPWGAFNAGVAHQQARIDAHNRECKKQCRRDRTTGQCARCDMSTCGNCPRIWLITEGSDDV